MPDHVLFVFLDGVGLGTATPLNPLAQATLPAFARLASGQPWTDAAEVIRRDKHVFRPLDATLGVEGLPQSGTGQAALFTGTNAPALAGRHFGPYPHSQTKEALRTKNLFRRAATRGRPAAFANAYPPRFFSYAAARDRWTVTTYCAHAAGLTIRTMDHLRQGRALAADVTGAGLQRIVDGVSVIPEAEAARLLLALARDHGVTLFEYFRTDKAGHSRRTARAARVLRSLDAFFGALLDAMDPQRELLLVCSDHGNLEDLSVKTHTRNPVPLVAYGAGAHAFSEAESLTDVTPALECVLQ